MCDGTTKPESEAYHDPPPADEQPHVALQFIGWSLLGLASLAVLPVVLLVEAYYRVRYPEYRWVPGSAALVAIIDTAIPDVDEEDTDA